MPDPLSPNVGSRFQLRRRLGAGAFGVVYEAFDLTRQRPVALKTLKNLTPEGLYRLKREFRSLADLQHPNLVELYELLCHGDTWLITMELVEGCDFLEWVRPRPASDRVSHDATSSLDGQGSTRTTAGYQSGAGDDERSDRDLHTLDASRLRSALRQLCEGVNEIHRAGKLHRDLKPSNVLVTGEGRLVILDFGLISDVAPVSGTRSEDFVGYAGVHVARADVGSAPDAGH